MKVSLISDIHLGHGKGTEIENDSFDALEEAIEKSREADLILVAGDIFDSRNPDTETIVRCMEILLNARTENSKVKFVETVRDKNMEDNSPAVRDGIPIVAIHGTHERRAKDLLNPVEALEKAGFLIHLHCNGIVFEKEGERVCIQGMSTVPDQYAESVLEEWNPKPMKNCFNILLLHQSVDGLVHAEHLLPMNKIPKGFDLYVLGHIHEPKLMKYDGKPLIVMGSAVRTQIRKESLEPAVFWKMDTERGEIKSINYETERKAYIFEDVPVEEIENIIRMKHAKKPIVKIVSDKIPPDFKIKYGDKVILQVRREEKEDMKRVELEEHRLSVQELGKKLLGENLKKAGLDARTFESVFELLLEKKENESLDAIKNGGTKHAESEVKIERGKNARSREWKDILKSPK